jgi:DNA primase
VLRLNKQEELLHAIDSLLGQKAILRKGGSDAVYFCPACKHYKRKFEVNLNTGKFHCWVCDVKGSNFLRLFKLLNAPLETYKILEGIQFSKSTAPIDTSSNECILPPEFISLADIKNKNSKFEQAIKYLINRGINKEDIFRYNIGYCAEGIYKNRIVIPSYDCNEKLNFYSARDFTGKQFMKYRLSPYSKNIIGFESLLNFKEPVTLVEGQFDAIAVRRNAIPLFGKTMSSKLKSKLLLEKPPRVNILLDTDAKKDAIRLCEFFIKSDIPVFFVELEKKDAADTGFGDVWNFIESSKEITFSKLIELKLYN